MSIEDRTPVIEALTIEDFFRSQFRTDAGAARSPIEIVDWGLKHIDRLRSALIEKRESRQKEWASKWIPLFSTILAVVALCTSTYLQVRAASDQRVLKQYELGFRPKVDGYTRLMQAVSTSFQRAGNAGDPALNAAFNEMEVAEIQLDPFLNGSARRKVREEVQQLIRFCLDVRRPNPTAPLASDKQIQASSFRNELRDTLYSALFQ